MNRGLRKILLARHALFDEVASACLAPISAFAVSYTHLDVYKRQEDMNVPQSLLFLRDTPVAISFTMIIIFLVTCLFAGADAVKELSGGKNWFMFSIMQSITFAAGVYIILQGCLLYTSRCV